MNPETGQIHPPEELAPMSRAERRKMVAIPPTNLEQIQAMDTSARKAWAARQLLERATKRNKRKAARRARRGNR